MVKVSHRWTSIALWLAVAAAAAWPGVRGDTCTSADATIADCACGGRSSAGALTVLLPNTSDHSTTTSTRYSIDRQAFGGAACASLLSLSIYAPLAAIEPGVFANLKALQSLIISSVEPPADGTKPVAVDLKTLQPPTLAAGSFTGLDAVTYLALMWLNLEQLPESVFEGLPSLLALNLLYHKLSSVPSDLFITCPQLMTVVLTGNKFTSYPALFNGLTPLLYVSMKDNQITALEVSSSKLMVLDMSYNALKSVTAASLDTPSLAMLDLESNQLQSISPTAFVRMNYLTSLRLGNNPGATTCQYSKQPDADSNLYCPPGGYRCTDRTAYGSYANSLQECEPCPSGYMASPFSLQYGCFGCVAGTGFQGEDGQEFSDARQCVPDKYAAAKAGTDLGIATIVITTAAAGAAVGVPGITGTGPVIGTGILGPLLLLLLQNFQFLAILRLITPPSYSPFAGGFLQAFLWAAAGLPVPGITDAARGLGNLLTGGACRCGCTPTPVNIPIPAPITGASSSALPPLPNLLSKGNQQTASVNDNGVYLLAGMVGIPRAYMIFFMAVLLIVCLILLICARQVLIACSRGAHKTTLDKNEKLRVWSLRLDSMYPRLFVITAPLTSLIVFDGWACQAPAAVIIVGLLSLFIHAAVGVWYWTRTGLTVGDDWTYCKPSRLQHPRLARLFARAKLEVTTDFDTVYGHLYSPFLSSLRFMWTVELGAEVLKTFFVATCASVPGLQVVMLALIEFLRAAYHMYFQPLSDRYQHVTTVVSACMRSFVLLLVLPSLAGGVGSGISIAGGVTVFCSVFMLLMVIGSSVRHSIPVLLAKLRSCGKRATVRVIRVKPMEAEADSPQSGSAAAPQATAELKPGPVQDLTESPVTPGSPSTHTTSLRRIPQTIVDAEQGGGHYQPVSQHIGANSPVRSSRRVMSPEREMGQSNRGLEVKQSWS